jgi:hypothetical protein
MPLGILPKSTSGLPRKHNPATTVGARYNRPFHLACNHSTHSKDDAQLSGGGYHR